MTDDEWAKARRWFDNFLIRGAHLGPLPLGEHASTAAELVSYLEPDEQEQLRQLLEYLGKGIAGPTDST